MNSKATENVAAERMKLTTSNDREIAMTRAFDAPRSQVFDAVNQARSAQALFRHTRLVAGGLRGRPEAGWRLSLRVAQQ